MLRLCLRQSNSASTGTRVPANTGVPPNTFGLLLMTPSIPSIIARHARIEKAEAGSIGYLNRRPKATMRLLNTGRCPLRLSRTEERGMSGEVEDLPWRKQDGQELWVGAICYWAGRMR